MTVNWLTMSARKIRADKKPVKWIKTVATGVLVKSVIKRSRNEVLEVNKLFEKLKKEGA